MAKLQSATLGTVSQHSNFSSKLCRHLVFTTFMAKCFPKLLKLTLSLIISDVDFDRRLNSRKRKFFFTSRCHAVLANSTGHSSALNTAKDEKWKRDKVKRSTYHFKILHRSPARCGNLLFPTHANIEGYWRVKVQKRINNRFQDKPRKKDDTYTYRQGVELQHDSWAF